MRLRNMKLRDPDITDTRSSLNLEKILGGDIICA